MNDWIKLWDDPEYKRYIKIQRQRCGNLKNIKAGDFEFHDELSNVIYKVKAPKYGDANLYLEQEKDPKKRVEVVNYIRVMQATLNQANSSILSSRALFRDAKDKFFHFKDYGLLTDFPQEQQIPYIIQLPVIDQGDRTAAIGKEKPRKKKEPAAKNNLVKKSSKVSPKASQKSPKASPRASPRVSPKKNRSPAMEQILAEVLGTRLPFKDRKECLSRATSAKYYISKKDLISAITENPKLISKVGTNYKTMTKDQICSKLFE